MHALPHLALVDWLSLAVFFLCWGGYAWFSERSTRGRGGLVARSHDFRLAWAEALVAREMRIVDASLINNLVTSVSFYANTTIYIIAGLFAALGAADKLIHITSDLPFGGFTGQSSQELVELKLVLLLGCFVYAYFKFTWSLRQFNLLSILVGAAPVAPEEGSAAYARRIAGTNSLAGDDFNRGIRAYYFGLAALGWLLNPWLLGGFSLLVVWVLYRRDYHSAVLQVLDRP